MNFLWSTLNALFSITTDRTFGKKENDIIPLFQRVAHCRWPFRRKIRLYRHYSQKTKHIIQFIIPGQNISLFLFYNSFIIPLQTLQSSIMTSCSHSSLLKTDSISCGTNRENPEDFQCVVVAWTETVKPRCCFSSQKM